MGMQSETAFETGESVQEGDMAKYIVRRLLLGAVIVFFGAMAAYFVIRLLPTTFVERMARQLSAQPGAKSYSELLAQLNQMYGLDGPILKGFFRWCGYALRGDFGESWKFHQPVVQKFGSVIFNNNPDNFKVMIENKRSQYKQMLPS